MKYARNYLNTASLADRIKESVAEGKSLKAAGGLGAREERKKARLEGEADFEEVRASYFNDIRDMFSEAFVPEKNAEEIRSYLEAPTTSPFPERSPESWENTPLVSGISADITDEGIRNILETIKGRESGGDYSVQNQKGTASGGYQFIDSTWKSLTSKYGIGTDYSSAKDAPPEVQDAVAAAYVQEILAQNNNDVSKVPLVWYTGNAQGSISKEALAVNDGLTPAEYQTKWLRRYNQIVGNKQ